MYFAQTEISRKVRLGVSSKSRGSACTLLQAEFSRTVRLCVSSKRRVSDCTLSKTEVSRKVRLDFGAETRGKQRWHWKCVVDRTTLQISRRSGPKLEANNAYIGNAVVGRASL